MKALNLHAVNDLRYEDVDLPQRKPDEVTVKIRAVGICGSDIPRIFTKGTYHFPTIPGHEFSGIIVDADDNNLIDKRVAVFPLIPCGKCTYCRLGDYQLCDHYDYYGSRRDGGFAEYLNVKIPNLVFLPDNVSYEEAAMCEPASVALHALRRCQASVMNVIAIWGIGPIGILIAKWAKFLGAKRIILIARDDVKKEFAQKLGFYDAINSQEDDPVSYIKSITDGLGADICIEGTGNSEPLDACLQCCKKMGKILCLGNPLGEMDMDQNSYWAILRKQLTLIGTWNSDFNDDCNDWKDTILAMSSGRLDVAPLITHKFTLEEYKDAFSVMRSKSIFSCKVMFINNN